jgi:hypothetical protein
LRRVRGQASRGRRGGRGWRKGEAETEDDEE